MSLKLKNEQEWYYNAGALPTYILMLLPHLVHRVPYKFGIKYHLVHELYQSFWPEWRTYYSIHLLIRHRWRLDRDSPIKEFNEENIRRYPFTYGQMARLVLFGTTDLYFGNNTIDWNFGHCRT